jgi:hypothetical protein
MVKSTGYSKLCGKFTDSLRMELRNEDKKKKKNLLQPKEKCDKGGNNETSFRSVTKMATKDIAEGRA